MNAEQICVLDIGGTHVSSACVDVSSWRLVDTATRLAVDPHAPAEEIIATFVRAAQAVPSDGPALWGVAMPDPFDYASGRALFQGVGKFESLYGVDVRVALLAGIVPKPVEVAFINDADAFVLGEWLNGAATGSRRCAGMTLGTGVGSGFVADGRIVDSGPTVPPGGRAHRLRIDGVPLEQVMSRRAIRLGYAEASGDHTADVREICDRARHGDSPALAALAGALRPLGAALGPWIARFGAEVLVVGGSMAQSWDVLEAPFTAGFASVATPPRIVVADDADRAPLLGAARCAVALSRSR